MSARTVLILGATGGIGAALAREYAGPDCRLILHGRDTARLDALSMDCRRRGASVETHAIDLRDTDAVRAWLLELTGRTRVDLAILNAGVTHSPKSGDEGWDAVEPMLSVNLLAPFAAVSVLVPAMRGWGGGQIALVSSLAAYFGMAITPAYSATKAALKSYGEALRSWLAPEGIAINVILPGFVDTPMSRRFPGPRPMLLSAERAARVIRKGLDANRPRIAFPLLLDLGMRWLAVLPSGWSAWILRRLGYGA